MRNQKCVWVLTCTYAQLQIERRSLIRSCGVRVLANRWSTTKFVFSFFILYIFCVVLLLVVGPVKKQIGTTRVTGGTLKKIGRFAVVCRFFKFYFQFPFTSIFFSYQLLPDLQLAHTIRRSLNFFFKANQNPITSMGNEEKQMKGLRARARPACC